MNTKSVFMQTACAAGMCLVGDQAAQAAQPTDSPRPNFVLIFTDDQGYGDLSCYGSTTIRTPNIDRLAAEGRKFTSFVVASSVCTPSRAALLTGSYPKRVGLHEWVLHPNKKEGLHPTEHTIADHLKEQGYATACFGKWHLGHFKETLPTAHGFDTYFGIPYSNDMNHPGGKGKPRIGGGGLDVLWNDPESTLTQWHVPLMEDEKIVELPVDQRTVTRRYTQKAIDFITANQDDPFFVYLPHTMPHIPLYVPDEVRDPDPENAYICMMEHIDAEVGRLLDAIDALGLTENTYVIFTSDNGPWLRFKHHAGSAGPLKGGKMSTFEGGHRVPCLIRGPGIPKGTVCDELATAMDVLPTIAAITGSPLPSDVKIDGMNTLGLWNGTDKESPRKEFLYYGSAGHVRGIRQGHWKYLRNMRKDKTPRLYRIDKDIGETTNLIDKHPEIVKRLSARIDELDAEITANARDPWVQEVAEEQ